MIGVDSKRRNGRVLPALISVVLIAGLFWYLVRPMSDRRFGEVPAIDTVNAGPKELEKQESFVPPIKSEESAMDSEWKITENHADLREPEIPSNKSNTSVVIEQVDGLTGSDLSTSDTAAALDGKDFSSVLNRVQVLLDSDNQKAAHELLSDYYRYMPLSQKQRMEVARYLEPLAEKSFFDPTGVLLFPRQTIQSGDTLSGIAHRLGVSSQYLQLLNAIRDPRRIRPGQEIKLGRGAFDAVVHLSVFELTVYHGDLWVRSYRIGSGQNDSTPRGDFVVKDKMENPSYDGAEGSYASDDPKNPVGEHWIDLGDGYGIHGTIEPQSIGTQSSRGCIRMLPDDVQEVFTLLTVGSQVQVLP